MDDPDRRTITPTCLLPMIDCMLRSRMNVGHKESMLVQRLSHGHDQRRRIYDSLSHSLNTTQHMYTFCQK